MSGDSTRPGGSSPASCPPSADRRPQPSLKAHCARCPGLRRASCTCSQPLVPLDWGGLSGPHGHPRAASRAGVWAPPGYRWSCARQRSQTQDWRANKARAASGTRSQPHQTAPFPRESPGPRVLLGLPYEVAASVGKGVARGQVPTVTPEERLTGPRRQARTLSELPRGPDLGQKRLKVWTTPKAGSPKPHRAKEA